jgi:predicted permease
MLANLVSDVRYCLRGFALRPAFAVVVVLTLAIALGVNVGVYSLYERLVLRSLPVDEPEALVNFVADGPKPGSQTCNNQGKCTETFSYPMFRDLEAAETPLEGIAASRFVAANLGFAGHTIPSQAALVSGQYFSLLRVRPALGRLIDRGDDRVAGGAEVAVLSYDYWSEVLGRDAAVLGRTLVVNGLPLTIVGVAQAGFGGTVVGEHPQVFVPITFRWHDRPEQLPNFASRSYYWLYLFGRLKQGVSLEQAEAGLNVPYAALLAEIEAPLVAQLSAPDLERFRAQTIALVPGARGQSNLPATASTPLALLLGATVIVLAAACVNLANLMLARSAGRVSEMAVRASLGAAPARLLRLLVVEALLLACAAAAASLPIAYAVLQAIGRLLPSIPQSRPELSLDAHAVVAALVLAGVATVSFAAVPLLGLVRTSPGGALHGGRTLGGKAVGRLRFSLATAQIGLSMLLLVLAGLFAQSLANATRLDLGLNTESLVTFGVAPQLNGYSVERSEQLFDSLERELAALPGVAAVGQSWVRLLSDSTWGTDVRVEGYEPAAGTRSDAFVNYVGGNLFRALEIPLLAGRDFTPEDAAGRPRVAIVNQSFAERFGLGTDPVGRHLDNGQTGPLDIEIVGLIRDAAYDNVKGPVRPQLILPRRQAAFAGGAATFYVRSARSADDMLASVRSVVARLDPNLPPTDLGTLGEQIGENLVVDRLLTTLAGALAAAATLLAALGLYGVLSYGVAQRTREIGLRLALGAAPERVRAMVLRQVAWMAAIGAPLGVLAALTIGRVASALLFGVTPADPGTLVAALAVLTAVVLAASYLPARRASRVDPMAALRAD